MPTTRCGHIRGLLNAGKARVVEREPFTIQLKYETPDVTQPLYLGIDPGRTNVGSAVVREDGECVFTAQLTTRNKDVPKLMKARKQFRMAHRRLKRRCKRQRRAKAAETLSQKGEFQRLLPGYEEPILCKGIRNKEARFNNRQRPAGWLTPTANHLLLTHLNMVKKLQKLLPITDVVLEVNRFAFMAMENPSSGVGSTSRGRCTARAVWRMRCTPSRTDTACSAGSPSPITTMSCRSTRTAARRWRTAWAFATSTTTSYTRTGRGTPR